MLKSHSKVVKIFPNKESLIRYASYLLMEIGEDWQTQRRYIKMINEDEKIEVNEYLLEEINKIKKERKLEKELVTL